MTNNTATKKTRKPQAQSMAAQIRMLVTRDKLTPKQIAFKLGAPLPYVYVVRSKMRAEARGLPAVAEIKMPVLGGIQDIHDQPTPPQIAVNPTTLAMQAPILTHQYAARVVIEQPSFFQRVKNAVRAWRS